jgi:hypothetical protein
MPNLVESVAIGDPEPTLSKIIEKVRDRRVAAVQASD